MKPKLILLVFVALIGFMVVKSDDIRHIDTIQNLNTFRILEGWLDLNDTSSCSEDITEYVTGLLTNQQWALKMFDSSAKIPQGILIGNTKFLGQYDECLGVEHPNGSFIGQYCLFNVKLGSENSSTIRNTNLFQEGQQTSLSLSMLFGLCLPSTCSPLEINSTLQNLFNASAGSAISLTLDPENCSTKESQELTDGDWAIVGFLILFVCIALVSTCYDVYQRFVSQNDKPHPLLSSFSIYSNGKFLFKTSKNSGQLEALHGIRTLSMCWVVLCHAYAFLLIGAVINFQDLWTRVNDRDHVVVMNGYVAVDSFFFLSGLLVCFIFFRDISKKGYYDVPLQYLHRYIRLTPPYAVMILIHAKLFPYFGNGPMWHSIGHASSQVCKDNWWQGLIYLQNYLTPSSSCLGQSWYLSADMQMYWLSPIVLYPLLLWPVFAPVYLGVLILGATFTTFAVAYVNDLGPSLMITGSAQQMTLDYAPFHTRATPWLMGCALGYIICGIKAKKIKIELSKFWIMIGWLASTALCLGCLYGYTYFEDNSDYTTLEAAFYLAFHRLGWSLGLCWVVFACVQGYGGPVNAFLSWSIFQPLGKLSYCTFLIHFVFQMYRLGSQRVGIYGSDLEIVYLFLGDLVLSNLASIPLTLIFEMPFGHIDRYLFRDVKILPLPMKKGKSRKVKEENNKADAENGTVNEGFQADK